MSEAGKGDRYRPVDREAWERGWERIFGGEPDSTDDKHRENRDLSSGREGQHLPASTYQPKLRSTR